MAVSDFLKGVFKDALEGFTRETVGALTQRTFSIARFQSNFVGQRTNHFRVIISTPRCLRANGTVPGGITPERLSFLCDNTSLPGLSLASSEVRRYGVGPIEKKPYAPVFADINMTFITDTQGGVLKFFHQWMRNIVNFTSQGRGPSGTSFGSPGAGLRPMSPYEVSYKSEYESEVTIILYDTTGVPSYTIRLHRAFPLFINEIPLSWAAADEILRIPVTFTFFDWSADAISAVATPARSIF